MKVKGPDWSSKFLQEASADGWAELPTYLEACDAAFADLQLASRFQAFSDNGPTVVCVMRNEERRLPSFLHHYDSLNVERIHVVDNGSTDSTAEILNSHPKVTVWTTAASYAQANFGQLWVGAIVRKYGLGKWVLNVDADELLVYSGDSKKDLRAFACWLESQNLKRLFAPMIDMYGKPDVCNRLRRLVTTSTLPLLREAPYFDAVGSSGNSPYDFTETPCGVLAIGGPRARLMLESDQRGSAFCLSKYPLALWDERTAYANVHFPYPFEQNSRRAFGALLHFKFLDDFSQRVNAAIAENEHWCDSVEYRKYEHWLAASPTIGWYSRRHSVRYRTSRSLIEYGIIHDIAWNECEGARYPAST